MPCPPGPGGEIDPRDSWPGGHEARSKFARTGRVLPVATILTVEEAQEFHNDCGHYDDDVALSMYYILRTAAVLVSQLAYPFTFIAR